MAGPGQPGSMPTPRDRHARVATTAVFFLTGFLYAAWATRIPAIKERLDRSAGELGVAILGLEAGALVGLPAGGALVARAGSRADLRIGFAVFPASLLCVGLAPALVARAGRARVVQGCGAVA